MDLGAAPEVGLAVGLAWTEVGGEILPTEVTVMPGKGQLILTGKLGEVMQESAKAAVSFIRTHASRLGVPENFHNDRDIHVHLPEGAIPKDGPSAGITLATALVSALTGLPVRQDIAMTGEMTLRGRILKIGGLKEKVLAAHRYGIRQIILPKDNQPDIQDVNPEIREELQFFPVSHVDEVLGKMLVRLKSGTKRNSGNNPKRIPRKRAGFSPVP
jgi:ATP-dependent Lon protease